MVNATYKNVFILLLCVFVSFSAAAQNDDISPERKQAIDSLALEKVRDLSKYISITVTKSLQYSFIIAFAYPIAPLLAASFADRLERKWIICGAAAAIAVFGMAFAQFTVPALLIACGVLITASNMTLSYAYHAYQTEVFPTAVRARAAGLVYSMSRVAAMFSGFIVAWTLREAGVVGVFGLITAAMVVVIVAIATWGP